MNEAARLQKHLPLLRTCAGWKANDLAEKLDVSRQTISAWENYDEAAEKKGVRLIALHYYAIRKLLDDEIAKDVRDRSGREKHILGILLEVLVDHPERYTEEDIKTVVSEAELMAPSIVKYPDRRLAISKVWPGLLYSRRAALSRAFIKLLGFDADTQDPEINDGIRQFMDLLNTDEAFRGKLKEMLESYEGEQTEEAVFRRVLLPLGQEYGLSVTFDEFKTYIDRLKNDDQEMSDDELAQVAGGIAKGAGGDLCIGFGFGNGLTRIQIP